MRSLLLLVSILCIPDDSSVEVVLVGAQQTEPARRSRVLQSLVSTLADRLARPERDIQHAACPDAAAVARIDRVPMNYAAFCAILQNLDLIRTRIRNRPGIGRVRNILVHEAPGLTDYWGRLRFSRDGDRLVDDTGYFEGVLVPRLEDILAQGTMTETGFMQKKDISAADIHNDVTTAKLLLSEVARERNMSVYSILEEKCNLSVVEELAYHGNSPAAQNSEVVNVCICKDSFCKEPCTDVIALRKSEIRPKD